MDHRDKINVGVLKNHVKSKCLKWKTVISIPTIPNHTQPFCGLYIHLLTQYRYHDSNTQPYPTDQPTHREWLSQLLSQGRTALIEIWICPGTTWNWYIFIYTHMHTHTHRYIYIYREREREIHCSGHTGFVWNWWFFSNEVGEISRIFSPNKKAHSSV